MMIGYQGLAIIREMANPYTPQSCVHFWNLYIGLDFDKNLKAYFKNSNELWSNEQIFRSKSTPNKFVHYSIIYCESLSKICFRLSQSILWYYVNT